MLRIVGLAGFLGLAVGCIGGGGGKESGTEGGACLPRNRCNVGLTCLSQTCVNPSSAADVIEGSDTRPGKAIRSPFCGRPARPGGAR